MLRILKSKSGNFSIMFGLTLPVLLLSAGMAVDISRMSAARSALQNNLDAAVMAATRHNDTDMTREEYFDQFLGATVSGDKFLKGVLSDFEVEKGANYIRTEATASADVDLTIMDIFGKKAQVSAASHAYEATDALEVVMVLDNTGSMESNNRIGALRNAATELVNTLEKVAENNPSRRIRLALVPFVTAVNIKAEDEFDMQWIDRQARAAYHGANFESVAASDGEDDERGKANKDDSGGGKCKGVGNDKENHNGNCSPDEEGEAASVSNKANHLTLFKKIGIEWKGCVEARPRSVALDAEPQASNPDTLFVPYFAPDEPDWDPSRNGWTPNAGNNSANLNNSYLDDMISDSDLKGLSGDARHFAIQRSLKKYTKNNPDIDVDGKGPLTGGPNRACPTPVVPLTDDFDKLKDAAKAMIQWNGSGTNVSEGLAWGTRILSPEAPFETGDPFDTEGTKKVVVLLTDGENVVYGASRTPNKSDYGGYNFMASGRFDSQDQGKAARNVDGWTKANCDFLKEREVEIYTVLLQADTAANRKLYSYGNGGCASAPENYFPTNNVSELESVFTKIADMVADLHFTH